MLKQITTEMEQEDWGIQLSAEVQYASIAQIHRYAEATWTIIIMYAE